MQSINFFVLNFHDETLHLSFFLFSQILNILMDINFLLKWHISLLDDLYKFTTNQLVRNLCLRHNWPNGRASHDSCSPLPCMHTHVHTLPTIALFIFTQELSIFARSPLYPLSLPPPLSLYSRCLIYQI